MSDKQLTIIDNLPPARSERQPADDPQSLIALAIEKGMDLKDLVLMRKEWRAEKAKEAYDVAMADFQAECPTIYKTKEGARTKPVGNEKEGKLGYKYAAFEDIIAIVKPLLKKHGFTFQLGTDVESKDGWVIATCKVTHSGGHSETSEAKFPLGAGTQIMSTTQVYAAALSFASRRVFMNSLGIVAAGEDMDGRVETKPRTQGPSKIATVNDLIAELWGVLEPVRGTGTDWTVAKQWLVNTGIIKQDEMLKKLSPDRLADIIDAAKSQLEKES